jgi:hypothetical protein
MGELAFFDVVLGLMRLRDIARAAHHGRNAGASCPPPTHRNGSRAVAAQKREDLGFHLRLTRSERRDARDDVERDQ